MSKYDYIIIGSGPTGLTLASRLSLLNKDYRILVLEKDDVYGGCHHVKKINGLLSEHGPRIYFDNYLNFIKLMKDLGFNDWSYYMKKYKVGLNDIASDMFYRGVKIYDLFISSLIFFIYPFLNRKKSVKDVMTLFNPSKEYIKYIDELCRLLDGGTIDSTTNYQFFELINQNLLYSAYISKINDVGVNIGDKDENDDFQEDIYENGLINHWINILKDRNVEFMKNVKVGFSNGYIHIGKKQELYGDTIIFCIPPEDLIKYNLFDNMNKVIDWSNKNKYINYTSITYHWKNRQNIIRKWGKPNSLWGIVYVVLNDSLISLAISKEHDYGHNKKKIHDCSKDEIVKEAFIQLLIDQPYLEDGFEAVFEQSTFNKNEGVWKMNNNAFMNTENEFLDFHTKYKNVYNCGTHNGHSLAPYTSLESAVQNATMLYNELIGIKDNDTTGFELEIIRPISVKNVLVLIIVCILIFVLLIK